MLDGSSAKLEGSYGRHLVVVQCCWKRSMLRVCWWETLSVEEVVGFQQANFAGKNKVWSKHRAKAWHFGAAEGQQTGSQTSRSF